MMRWWADCSNNVGGPSVWI